MSKPCADCPFMRSSPLNGSVEWLEDVFNMHRKNPFFRHTCHKTDPKADGYAGGKKVVECRGHITMMINKLDKTPGMGGVYNSMDELIEVYLRNFLGDHQFEELRAQRVKEKVLCQG